MSHRRRPVDPLRPRPLLRGQVVRAIYRVPELAIYAGNPLLEALPRIWAPSEVESMLRRFPPFEPSERDLPAYLRIHAVRNVQRVFQPLNRHIDLEQRISAALRQGYIGRTPLAPAAFWRAVDLGLESMEHEDGTWEQFDLGTTTGFALVGLSGLGKSTALERILKRYPQVIGHTRYGDVVLPIKQLVWLKIDCPWDGSARAWCLSFFEAVDAVLGTKYRTAYTKGRPSAAQMLPYVVRVASAHWLGLLVIDEIQNLAPGDELLKFFVQLNNTIGVPVVKVGTYRALRVLAGALHEARRNTGQGDMVWFPLEIDSPDWRALLEAIWPYYYLPEPIRSEAAVRRALHDQSQGIPDFAVKLWILAQVRAVLAGRDRLTAGMLEQVARESFQLVRPALEALRHGRQLRKGLFDRINDIDITAIDIEPAIQAARQAVVESAVLAGVGERVPDQQEPAREPVGKRTRGKRAAAKRPQLGPDDLRTMPGHDAIRAAGQTAEIAELLGEQKGA